MDKVNHVDLLACHIMLYEVNDRMATGTSMCDDIHHSTSVAVGSTEESTGHCDFGDNYDCNLYG
jgi:hypothetical protein